MRQWSCLILFAVAPLFAQPAAPEATLAARFKTFVDASDISGAVAVCGRAEGAPIVATVGVRDLASAAPMTPDTVFRIASMTKPVTALAIMILADDGKLSPDDLAEKFIPELKNATVKVEGVARPASRPVKLRDLLTHTSGVPGGMPNKFKDLYAKRDRTLAEVAPALASRPLQFEPGAKWAYCNAGIDLLGRVVEVASGQSYERFVQERVFTPLGMADTMYYPSPALVSRMAKTYGKKDGKLVETPYTLIGPGESARYPVPAGGLVSTAGDLAKLYRMMLNRGTLDGRRVLSEAGVRTMTSLQTGDIKTGFVDGMGYGFGWGYVREPMGVTGALSPGSYGHGGAFGTQGWIDPVKGRYVVLLIQRTGLANGDASPMRQTLHEEAAKLLP